MNSKKKTRAISVKVDRDVLAGRHIITVTRNNGNERAMVVLDSWQQAAIGEVKQWLTDVVAECPALCFDQGLRVTFFSVGPSVALDEPVEGGV